MMWFARHLRHSDVFDVNEGPCERQTTVVGDGRPLGTYRRTTPQSSGKSRELNRSTQHHPISGDDNTSPSGSQTQHLRDVGLEQIVQPGGAGAFFESHMQTAAQTVDKLQNGCRFGFEEGIRVRTGNDNTNRCRDPGILARAAPEVERVAVERLRRPSLLTRQPFIRQFAS